MELVEKKNTLYKSANAEVADYDGVNLTQFVMKT